MSEKYFDNTEKDDGTVALTGDDGNVVRFFHIGTIEYKNEWFVFFQPAEPKEGIDPDEVVIFKLSGDGSIIFQGVRLRCRSHGDRTWRKA